MTRRRFTALPEGDDLPDRQTHRHRGHDYTLPGLYFVTIFLEGRRALLGRISSGEMQLSGAGRMVETAWTDMQASCPWVRSHESIVMPDHFHGVVRIMEDQPCTARAMSGDHKDRPYPSQRPRGTLPRSLGRAIQAFKSVTTCRYVQGVEESGWPRFETRFWHRNYHDSVIRTQEELDRVVAYIKNNPRRWDRSQSRS